MGFLLFVLVFLFGTIGITYAVAGIGMLVTRKGSDHYEMFKAIFGNYTN